MVQVSVVQVAAWRTGAKTALALAVAASAWGLPTAPARAQAKLEAQYRATLAGWPIGSGSWKIDLANGRYTMVATGQSSGLASVFTGGNGTASARGAIRGNRVMPDTYALSIRTSRNHDQVRMGLAGGAVNALSVEPPIRFNENHTPLTEAHKRGVLDPISAGILPGAGTSGLGPAVCRRTVGIFDGRQRFDLTLSFKRMDSVQAQVGYSGPVVVCGVRYSPVGGHDKNRPATRFLRESRDIEMWYAPIVGTRFVAVYRIGIPTAFGLAVLEATRFEIASSPRRSARKRGPR